MSPFLAVYLVQVAGLALVLIYGMPWKGRQPRSRALSMLGALAMIVAGLYYLLNR